MMIRNEIRLNDQGEAEVWANLGDILGWLDTLPEHTSHPVAAGTALEIRQILLQQIDRAATETLGE
jgi:hypothetical protein